MVENSEEVEGKEENVTEVSGYDLKLLDYEDGINHCAGSEKIYLSVLGVALKNSEADIEKLMTCYNEKDYDGFGVQAHAMKGSCLNIGAKLTGENARKMEFAGKEGNATYIEENLDAFIDEYRALMTEIQEYMKAEEW